MTGQVDEAGQEESVYVCADMGPAGESPCPEAALRGDDYCYAHGKAWDEAHPEVEVILKSELDALRADRDRLAGQVAAIRALLAEPAPSKYDEGGNYEGRVGGSEHRTVGQRAWCHACGEWCYDGSYACPCCEPKIEPEDIRAALVASSPTTPEAKK